MIRAIDEIINSEKSYLRHLELVEEYFMNPIREGINRIKFKGHYAPLALLLIGLNGWQNPLVLQLVKLSHTKCKHCHQGKGGGVGSFKSRSISLTPNLISI